MDLVRVALGAARRPREPGHGDGIRMHLPVRVPEAGFRQGVADGPVDGVGDLGSSR